MGKYVSSPIALQLYFNSGENDVTAPTVVDGITRRAVDLPQCTIRKCIEFIGTYSNPNRKGSSFARGKRTIKKDLHHIDCTSHSIKTLFQAIYKYHARYKNQYGHYEIKYDVKACYYILNYIIDYVNRNASEAIKERLLGENFASVTFYGIQLGRLSWLADSPEDSQNEQAIELLNRLGELE